MNDTQGEKTIVLRMDSGAYSLGFVRYKGVWYQVRDNIIWTTSPCTHCLTVGDTEAFGPGNKLPEPSIAVAVFAAWNEQEAK